MEFRWHIVPDMLRNALVRLPFVFLCLPLIAGVVAARLFVAEIHSYTAVAIIAASAFVSILLSTQLPSMKEIAFLAWFFVFGFCFAQAFNTSFGMQTGARTISAEIVSAPQEKAKTYKCEILTENPKTKSLIYIKKDSASALLRMGDRVQVSGEFREITNSGENPFDYKAFLANKHIFSQAYIPAGQWQKLSSKPSLRAAAVDFRKTMIERLQHNPHLHESYTTLAALIFGDTSLLETSVIRAYSASGAMHVLAVSGLHVGIMASILMFLLSFVPQRLYLVKIIISLAGIWFYAFITGLVPSVFRASTMFSIVSIAVYLNRSTSIYNSLAVAAVVSILIDPNCIADVGFQLSYLAVIGIAYFGTKIQNSLNFENKIYNYVWGIVAISIAVQITTLPISMYYFGSIPIYSLLTNILVIPLAFVVVLLCVATLIIGSFPIVGTGISWLLNYVCEYLNHVVESIASFPHAQTFVHLSPSALAILLAAVACAICIIEYRRHVRIARLIEED
ncbi:MAG: ComEC family competence protein [Bacteroidales bacterium]|jgi:competence protein ComEC|nr:ComEC family competence protein [Bacteroidales bacterium]